MVAVSLLSLAIVAPMSLASQSLASAYYARDQVTAAYLAQEGIEAVRSIRDGNILQISQGATLANGLLTGIPTGQPFVIDTRTNQTWTTCTAATLKTDGTFYGYGTGPCVSNDVGWTATHFARTMTANFVSGTTDEIKLTATVTWASGGFASRSVTISENLYRWVNDGSGAQ
jgi:Tfp pilus assembly protein PilV